MKRITKKHIWLEIDKQISMQELKNKDTNSRNPILSDINVDTKKILELTREYFGIIPKSKSIRSSERIADHLCIDVLMSPEYADLKDQRFSGFVKQLTYVVQEIIDSHSKLLSIEKGISSSLNIAYSSMAHFTQNVLEYYSTIRYFFKLLDVDLPRVDLSNEFWAEVHFTADMVKINGDTVLSLGQMIESGSYYARLELYDMLSEANTDEKLTDLMSFAQACGKHIAIGAGLGLASGAPVYGAINGAAMCLQQHQMLAETDTQTAMRYVVDAVAGVTVMYELADQNALVQVIGAVSTISMSDIAMKVSMATAELGFNEVNNIFEIGDYEILEFK